MADLMLDLKDFYSGFQVNFFTYKQLKLKEELENFESNTYSYKENFVEYEKEEHLNSIKIDIRQTYFQAIETLFELIISLQPKSNGYFDDENILKSLAKKKHHYEEIRKFGSDEGGLNFLHKRFKISDGQEITALHYIFYLTANSKTFEDIPASLEAIEYGLKFLAKDISDRREYNSMKHGLRIYRALNNFGFLNFDYDLKDSMTFYEENIKTGEIEFITKVFDSQRDIQMTFLCSSLISNIIYTRRVKLLNYKKRFHLYFFTKDNIDAFRKVNVTAQNISLKYTPL